MVLLSGACWLVCLGFCLCFVLACWFLVSRGISASNLFSFLLKIPAVDRPCLVLARQCRKKNQDMEIDCIKNVTTDLSAKACQTKDVLTEVDRPLSSAKTLESVVSDPPAVTKVSSIPHVSCEENVGRFHNMRKECRIKTFDGLGPFSYFCRMIRNEPNTNITGTGKSETVASSVNLCEPQLGHAGSSLTEEFIEGRHFVCAIDEVNCQGFPS